MTRLLFAVLITALSLPALAAPVHFNFTGIATEKLGAFAGEASNSVTGTFEIDLGTATDNASGFNTFDEFDDSLNGIAISDTVISITGHIRLGALEFSVGNRTGAEGLQLADGILNNPIFDENIDRVRLYARETSPGAVTFGRYTSASLELFAEDRATVPGEADGINPGSGGLDNSSQSALNLLSALELSLFSEGARGRYVTSELVGEFPIGVPLFETIDELEFEWTSIAMVVPLPPTMWLFLTGVVCLLGLNRK